MNVIRFTVSQSHSMVIVLASLLMLAPLSAAQSTDTTIPPNPDQLKAAWLNENAVIVDWIDTTTHEGEDDFADLLPLIDLIGEARMVSLGEQTHGDGAAFQAKVRLVQFLHQHMGFDVLVWESGLYDCAQVDKAFKAGGDPIESANNGIFGIWTLSEQVRPVFDYVAQTQNTEHPIETAGFDCQLTGPDSLGLLLKDLNEFFYRIPSHLIPVSDQQEILKTIRAINDAPRGQYAPTEAEAAAFRDTTERTAIALDAITPKDLLETTNVDTTRCRFLARTLRNLAGFHTMMFHMGSLRTDPNNAQQHQLKTAQAREKHMSDSLIWLAQEQYPNRKMIVWAASSHMTHHSKRIEVQDPMTGWFQFEDSPWSPMGDAVKEALGDDWYAIMFIANSGKVGSVMGQPWMLTEAPMGSLDAICHETGQPYLFVDLKSLPHTEGGAWLNERLVARPRGYSKMQATWSEVCDAMFFTDKMTPSTRATPADNRSNEDQQDN